MFLACYGDTPQIKDVVAELISRMEHHLLIAGLKKIITEIKLKTYFFKKYPYVEIEVLKNNCKFFIIKGGFNAI